MITFRSGAVLGCTSALVFFLAGCATVTRGTTEQIQIESDPAGAQAHTSLNHQCVTPCTITVNRKDEFSVVFSKDGYEKETIEVKTGIAGTGAAGFAGNVLIGGVVGMGVDAATGSTLEHKPNPVVAKLRKLAPAPKVEIPPKTSKNRKGKVMPMPQPVPPAPEAVPEPSAD